MAQRVGIRLLSTEEHQIMRAVSGVDGLPAKSDLRSFMVLEHGIGRPTNGERPRTKMVEPTKVLE